MHTTAMSATGWVFHDNEGGELILTEILLAVLAAMFSVNLDDIVTTMSTCILYVGSTAGSDFLQLIDAKFIAVVCGFRCILNFYLTYKVRISAA